MRLDTVTKGLASAAVSCVLVVDHPRPGGAAASDR
jgi:hypothetical protein